ncbi:MAG: hypothetical protein H6510_06820 [Acidobacteria bacterium]|nr:hypothetical protein [Acidobacteriota bacterium]MCB9397506.1 hypothetical protein [Acidobacteriota bacterium]
MAFAALDLGSTRLKAAILKEDKSFQVWHVPSPRVFGKDPIREMRPKAFLSRLNQLMRMVRVQVKEPLIWGISSQRSTFAVWSGDRFLTPLISWQDRRAIAWCEQHQALASWIWQRTGLKLSPHYMGPKLATLAVSKRADVRFGTLETLLMDRWTQGEMYRAEPSMAARTQLVHLQTGTWDETVAQRIGLPGLNRPTIWPNPQDLPIHGSDRLRTVISDQAAGVLPILKQDASGVLINLGTGGFVLKATDQPSAQPPYLVGPVNARFYALEATLNKIGDLYQSDFPSALPPGFAFPDAAGWGSPYWRPQMKRTYSKGVRGSARSVVGRLGIAFRLFEILQAFQVGQANIYLAGGGSNDPLIGRALATLVGRPIHRLSLQEASLAGVFCEMLEMRFPLLTETIDPDPELTRLETRFPEWQAWVADL